MNKTYMLVYVVIVNPMLTGAVGTGGMGRRREDVIRAEVKSL
jgi:hypothetical protein